MELIDTHSHLYAEEFDNDINEVIDKAKKNGIKKVVLPAIDSSSHNKLLALAEKHPNFTVPLMGLHPTSVKNNYKKELDIIENLITKQKTFYGIGEIGIDLYHDKTYKNEQIDAFSTQVKWAKELNIPIVIHTRSSFNEVYKTLKPLIDDKLTGVFHCFSGSIEQAKQIIDMNFMLGIGGVVTFKNAKLPEVLSKIDLKHIVLETDSPYLAPTPFRGKRNDSSYIKLIAEKIAEIHKIALADVAEITTKNAKSLFKI